MDISASKHNGDQADAARQAEADSRLLGFKLAAVFAVFSVLLLVAAALYLAHRQTEARATAHRELSAIADLKLRQIQDWRQERMADARFFAHARFVAEDVQRFLTAPNTESNRQAVLHWLRLLKAGERYYGVVVFDSRLDRRLALPDSSNEPQALLRPLLQRSLQEHDVVMSDLHRHGTNDLIHVDVLFPVYADAAPETGPPIAVVVLELDPRQFLFPLIQSWPTPSRTAETLLVRREGDSVLYLNDVRHHPGAALAMRLPWNSPTLPAARILRGESKPFEGVDYRGVPVLAAGREVPGTDWVMVAKVDSEEIYAPLRRQSATVAAVIGALLVAGASLMALLWRHGSARMLERELALEREHAAERKAHEREIERLNRLYAALSQVNQAVVRNSTREELIKQVCQVLIEFGGFHMAWVGWMEAATGRVVPLARCGDVTEYLERVQVYADDRPEGRGPVGTAIRTGSTSICQDCLADPAFVPWREAATIAGWRSMAALPIREQEKVRGALAVYSQQADFFEAKEQQLLEEAAADLSFGLDRLLSEQRRQEAENAMRTAKADLARANTALEQTVLERTAQLRETIGELEAFSYSLSHDLRAPLRAIRSFHSILLAQYREPLGQDGADLLERAAKAAERMDQLITDVLAFSRISRAEMTLRPIDLEKVLRQIIQERPELQPPRAEVLLECPLAPVLGQEASLIQCLANLLGNAVKFVALGVQPHVRVWTEAGTCGDGEARGAASAQVTAGGQGDRARVRLWVEDNGIGIEREAQEKIFGIFQRLHSQQEYEGTGIGLAIVKKAVERMGGRVGVESEPGQGSRFWIELRAA